MLSMLIKYYWKRVTISIDPTDHVNRTHRNELSVHAMNTSEECTVVSKDCTKIEA